MSKVNGSVNLENRPGWSEVETSVREEPLDVRTDIERKLDEVARIVSTGRRDVNTIKRLTGRYRLNCPEEMVTIIADSTLCHVHGALDRS